MLPAFDETEFCAIFDHVMRSRTDRSGMSSTIASEHDSWAASQQGGGGGTRRSLSSTARREARRTGSENSSPT